MTFNSKQALKPSLFLLNMFNQESPTPLDHQIWNLEALETHHPNPKMDPQSPRRSISILSAVCGHSPSFLEWRCSELKSTHLGSTPFFFVGEKLPNWNWLAGILAWAVWRERCLMMMMMMMMMMMKVPTPYYGNWSYKIHQNQTWLREFTPKCLKTYSPMGFE